jgi:hypothetical protein
LNKNDILCTPKLNKVSREISKILLNSALFHISNCIKDL